MLGLTMAALLAVQGAIAPAAPPDGQAEVPPPEEVMAMPAELREEFQRKVLDVASSPEQRLNKLVGFMFEKNGLGLEYQPDATLSVSESYERRRVNCLAFTMLAIALAREAGLSASAQQINRILAWGASGDIVVQSLHANAVVDMGNKKFMLDIASCILQAVGRGCGSPYKRRAPAGPFLR